MRSIFFTTLVLFPALCPSQALVVGPFGPRDATSVVHVDLKALRNTELGKVVSKSALGVAGAKLFRELFGYDWQRIETLRLASVARPEGTKIRDLWVLHLRGKKLLPPKHPSGFVVDALAAKSVAASAIGYLAPGPDELVFAEARYLRERCAGKKIGPTSPAADRAPPYVLRAIVQIPRVGIAQVGTWEVPLLDGVDYSTDPLQEIRVELGFGRARIGDLRADFFFPATHKDGHGKLWRWCEERRARALRQREFFAFWPALEAIRFARKLPEAPNLHFKSLRVSLTAGKPAVLRGVLRRLEPYAALLDFLARQLAASRRVPKVEVVESEVELEEELEVEASKLTKEERDAKRKKERRRPDK